MDASDFIALFLVILGFAYILRWYLNRHFVGSRTGDSTCSICGGDLTIEKESIGKEISKRLVRDSISKYYRSLESIESKKCGFAKFVITKLKEQYHLVKR